MKGENCLILPIGDMRKVMEYIRLKIGFTKETYKEMQELGCLEAFMEIQRDVKEEDTYD